MYLSIQFYFNWNNSIFCQLFRLKNKFWNERNDSNISQVLREKSISITMKIDIQMKSSKLLLYF